MNSFNQAGRLEATNNAVCRSPWNTERVRKNNGVFSSVEAVSDSLPISKSDSSKRHVVSSEAQLHESFVVCSLYVYSSHVTTKEYWYPKRASSIQCVYRKLELMHECFPKHLHMGTARLK